MYVIRDIFQLKFGQFREAKALLEEAKNRRLLPEGHNMRALSDFTGGSYRLILEEGFDTLAAYEQSLTDGMKQPEWQDWYKAFKPLVAHSYREILKTVL